MNRTILLVTALFFNVVSFGQRPPARLIVRGDDMGFSHSGNLALIKTWKEGISRSIEIIVPSPWFPEAVALLQQNRSIDVGIHLAITSEWDNVKWRPVSHCPSLVDSSGYFFPMVYRNPNYPGRSIVENKWRIEDIEKEFRAQIELALKKIPWISHVSAHMGCTGLNSEVSAMARKLAKEYRIDIDLGEQGVKYVGYEGAHATLEEKIKGFTAMLNKLEPGNTYLFVDHPGIDNEELRAIHHIGYENVAQDRQGVTDLWTKPEIKKLIADKGIQLISYKDLKK